MINVSNLNKYYNKGKSNEKESKGFYSILKEAKKKADRRM